MSPFEKINKGVKVVTTAPMPVVRKDNMVTLEENPLIGVVSDLGVLGRRILTDGTVVEIYTETEDGSPPVSIKIRLSNSETQILLDGNGDPLSYENNSNSDVYSLSNNLSKGELVELILEIRRELSSRYGTTPSVLIVDKTGRYGFLPMIMPGGAARGGLGSGLSEKTFMEFMASLEKIFTFISYEFKNYFEKVVSFMQIGTPAAASEGLSHLHLVEFINKGKYDGLPVDTKKTLSRFVPKELNGEYVQDILFESLLENSLEIIDLILKEINGDVGDEIEGDEFRNELLILKESLGGKNNRQVKIDKILYFFSKSHEKIQIVFSKNEKGANQSQEQRAAFEIFVKNFKKIYARWDDLKEKSLEISNARPIFTAGFLKKIEPILNIKIEEVLRGLPESIKKEIKVSIVAEFGKGDAHPRIQITTSFENMALYGQQIQVVIDKTLDEYWNKEIFPFASRLVEGGSESESESDFRNLLEILE